MAYLIMEEIERLASETGEQAILAELAHDENRARYGYLVEAPGGVQYALVARYGTAVLIPADRHTASTSRASKPERSSRFGACGTESSGWWSMSPPRRSKNASQQLTPPGGRISSRKGY